MYEFAVSMETMYEFAVSMETMYEFNDNHEGMSSIIGDVLSFSYCHAPLVLTGYHSVVTQLVHCVCYNKA